MKEWIRVETFHSSGELENLNEKSKRAEFSPLSIRHDGIWLIFMIFLVLHGMAGAWFVIAKDCKHVTRYALGMAKYALEFCTTCGKQSPAGSAGIDNEPNFF